MKLSKVEYQMLFNTGNYENERITLEAVPEGEETVQDVVFRLREECLAVADQVGIRHSHLRMSVYEE